MNERPLLSPEKLTSNSYPTKERIQELGIEMVREKISMPTRLLFAKLAVMKPRVRLAVNLKTLIGLMVSSGVSNILTEGLTPQEHSALVELDLRGLSLSSRETAHGLLNIHERWSVSKALRRVFRRADESNGGHLESPKGDNGESSD